MEDFHDDSLFFDLELLLSHVQQEQEQVDIGYGTMEGEFHFGGHPPPPKIDMHMLIDNDDDDCNRNSSSSSSSSNNNNNNQEAKEEQERKTTQAAVLAIAHTKHCVSAQVVFQQQLNDADDNKNKNKNNSNNNNNNHHDPIVVCKVGCSIRETVNMEMEVKQEGREHISCLKVVALDDDSKVGQRGILPTEEEVAGQDTTVEWDDSLVSHDHPYPHRLAIVIGTNWSRVLSVEMVVHPHTREIHFSNNHTGSQCITDDLPDHVVDHVVFFEPFKLHDHDDKNNNSNNNNNSLQKISYRKRKNRQTFCPKGGVQSFSVHCTSLDSNRTQKTQKIIPNKTRIWITYGDGTIVMVHHAAFFPSIMYSSSHHDDDNNNDDDDDDDEKEEEEEGRPGKQKLQIEDSLSPTSIQQSLVKCQIQLPNVNNGSIVPLPKYHPSPFAPLNGAALFHNDNDDEENINKDRPTEFYEALFYEPISCAADGFPTFLFFTSENQFLPAETANGLDPKVKPMNATTSSETTNSGGNVFSAVLGVVGAPVLGAVGALWGGFGGGSHNQDKVAEETHPSQTQTILSNKDDPTNHPRDNQNDDDETTINNDETSLAVVNARKSFFPTLGNDAIPLYAGFEMHDAPRQIEFCIVDPDGNLAATTDGLGRVLLIDLSTKQIVRMWKGFRKSVCCWHQVVLNSTLDDATSTTLSSKALFLVIHSQQRRVVEVWQVRHGNRIKSIQVGRDAHILSCSQYIHNTVSCTSTTTTHSDMLLTCYLIHSNVPGTSFNQMEKILSDQEENLIRNTSIAPLENKNNNIHDAGNATKTTTTYDNTKIRNTNTNITDTITNNNSNSNNNSRGMNNNDDNCSCNSNSTSSRAFSKSKLEKDAALRLQRLQQLLANTNVPCNAKDIEKALKDITSLKDLATALDRLSVASVLELKMDVQGADFQKIALKYCNEVLQQAINKHTNANRVVQEDALKNNPNVTLLRNKILYHSQVVNAFEILHKFEMGSMENDEQKGSPRSAWIKEAVGWLETCEAIHSKNTTKSTPSSSKTSTSCLDTDVVVQTSNEPIRFCTFANACENNPSTATTATARGTIPALSLPTATTTATQTQTSTSKSSTKTKSKSSFRKVMGSIKGNSSSSSISSSHSNNKNTTANTSSIVQNKNEKQYVLRIYFSDSSKTRRDVLVHIFKPLLGDIFAFNVVNSVFGALGIKEDVEYLLKCFGEWFMTLPAKQAMEKGLFALYSPMLRWLQELVMLVLENGTFDAEHDIALRTLHDFCQKSTDLVRAFMLGTLCREAVASAALQKEKSTYGRITTAASVKSWDQLLRKLRVCLLVSQRLTCLRTGTFSITVHNVDQEDFFSVYEWLAHDELSMTQNHEEILSLENACQVSGFVFNPSTKEGDNPARLRMLQNSCLVASFSEEERVEYLVDLEDDDRLGPLLLYLSHYNEPPLLLAHRASLLASKWSQNPADIETLNDASVAIQSLCTSPGFESLAFAVREEIWQTRIRPIFSAILFGFDDVQEISENIIAPLLNQPEWIDALGQVALKILNLLSDIEFTDHFTPNMINTFEPPLFGKQSDLDSDIWPPIRKDFILQRLVERARIIDTSALDAHRIIVCVLLVSDDIMDVGKCVPSCHDCFQTTSLFNPISLSETSDEQKLAFVEDAIIARAQAYTGPTLESLALGEIDLLCDIWGLEMKNVRTLFFLAMYEFGKDRVVDELLTKSIAHIDVRRFVEDGVDIVCRRLHDLIHVNRSKSPKLRDAIGLLDADLCEWIRDRADQSLPLVVFSDLQVPIHHTHLFALRLLSFSRGANDDSEKRVKIHSLIVLSGTLVKAMEEVQQEEKERNKQ